MLLAGALVTDGIVADLEIDIIVDTIGVLIASAGIFLVAFAGIFQRPLRGAFRTGYIFLNFGVVKAV